MGKLVAWLKLEGEQVKQGEIIMEIETDRATVEIEAPASGILRGISAEAGEGVPVGETITWIADSAENIPNESIASAFPKETESPAALSATPLARKVAEVHRVDLTRIKSDDKRILKKDVLAFIEQQLHLEGKTRLQPASPKASRLAGERGLAIEEIAGSGPQGAVLAADILSVQAVAIATPGFSESGTVEIETSTTWQRMAERVTQSWTSVPHFYLQREIHASRLIAWRENAQKSIQHKLTFTDLLIKLVAAALRLHPRMIAHWEDGHILSSEEINLGSAMAVDEGWLVPVIHVAERLNLGQIAQLRQELMERA